MKAPPQIAWPKWGVEVRVDGSIAVVLRKTSVVREIEMVGGDVEIEWLRNELSAALRRQRRWQRKSTTS